MPDRPAYRQDRSSSSSIRLSHIHYVHFRPFPLDANFRRDLGSAKVFPGAEPKKNSPGAL